MNTFFTRLFIIAITFFYSSTFFAQMNIKVIVEEIKVINALDCDAIDNSDFVFEFKATDNTPFANSNNSPLLGSIGQCNYAVVNESNGPFTIIPPFPGSAIFNPTNAVFFDRNYTCKKDIPSAITLVWRGYQNEDVVVPSTTPNANGITSINTSIVGITLQAPYVQAFNYSVTSNDGGCPQTYVLKLTVAVSYNPAVPLFIDHTHQTIICMGATNGEVEGHPIGGTGTVLYDWSNDGLGDYDDQLVLSGLPAGTYTFIAKDALNCTDTLTAEITTIAPPTNLSSFTTSTSTVCTGQENILYSVAAQPNSYYIWSYNGGGGVTTFSASNSFSVNYSTAATSGTISVYATNNCSTTPSLTLPITVIQTPTLIISGSNTVCDNSQEIITVFGGSAYLWNTGATTPSITVTSSAIYTVTETNSGCNAFKQFTVTVLPSPTVQVTANTPTVCPSSPSLLMANGNGSFYVWSDGFIGATHTVSAVSNVVYTVTNVGANACFAQVLYTLNVIPGPQIIASGSTEVCLGNTATITASGADTYSWSTGETTTSVLYKPIGTKTISVTGKELLTGCQTKTIVTLTNFNTTPVAIVGSSSVCDYTSQTYIATGANFYKWQDASTSNVFTITPVTNTTLSVIGTDLNGCNDTTDLVITVLQVHITSITGLDTICSGQQTILTANSTGATSYSWSTGANSNSISVSPTTTFTYTAKSINGSCLDTKSHVIAVKTPPQINFNILNYSCVSNPVYTLNAIPNGGIYIGTGVFGNTFNPSVGVGIYPITYQLIGTNGCQSSVSQTMEVQSCVGLNELKAEFDINIFPNPSYLNTTIKSSSIIKTVTLFDFSGRVITSYSINSNMAILDLENISSGIYTIAVTTINNGCNTLKLIKE